MKFELVDFYPFTDANRGKIHKKFLGTVHIYDCASQLDIRGILVSKLAGKKSGFFYYFPHFTAIDTETKKKVKYPYISFTDQKKKKAMMEFLKKSVTPEVKKAIFGS